MQRTLIEPRSDHPASMADLTPASQLFEQFKAAVGKDDAAAAKRLLSSLKLELTKLGALPPVGEQGPNTQQQILLARDVLELAVLASVRQADDAAFERNYAQLRPYYTDVRAALPLSPQEPLMAGLHLLALLVQNRIAEFHSAVEVIPAEVLAAPEVTQVLELEQWLMEGAYSKVLAARASPASPHYAPLLDRFSSTVRDEIASCCEASYATLPAADAMRMLMLGSEAELAEYAEQQGWETAGGRIVFKSAAGAAADAAARPVEVPEEMPAFHIIEHCLEYAREIERIV